MMTIKKEILDLPKLEDFADLLYEITNAGLFTPYEFKDWRIRTMLQLGY